MNKLQVALPLLSSHNTSTRWSPSTISDCPLDMFCASMKKRTNVVSLFLSTNGSCSLLFSFISMHLVFLDSLSWLHSIYAFSIPYSSFSLQINYYSLIIFPPRASLGAQLVKNLPAIWETCVQFLDWEDPLEKGKATHSSILAWRIPRTVSFFCFCLY